VTLVAQAVPAGNEPWLDLVTLLLGGAGVTLITTAVWAINTLRTGARARAREILVDLEQARDRAEDRARAALDDTTYWQNVVGAYAYQLRRGGITPDPLNPRPPSVTGRPVEAETEELPRIRGRARPTGSGPGAS
jgi:hypothetical protein